MEPRSILLPVLTAAFWAVSLAAPERGPETEPLVPAGPAPQVAILTIGGLGGEIDTCSCGGDFGGLPRWVGYDRLFRKTYPDTPVLWLDAGAMYRGGSPTSDLQQNGMLAGYEMIGMKAANLSEREIYQGLGAFLKWRERIPIPLVSTNIWRRRTGEPLVHPYRIEEMPIRSQEGGTGTFRIGILGLNRLTKWPAYSMHAAQFLLRDPAEAAALALEELEGKTDYNLVLSYMPVREARKIAGQVEGIDLILGHTGGRTRAKEIEGRNRIGDTRIVYSRTQGTEISEVRLFLEREEAGGWSVRTGIHRILLDERYPEDPEGADLRTRIQAEMDLLAGESESDAPAPAAGD